MSHDLMPWSILLLCVRSRIQKGVSKHRKRSLQDPNQNIIRLPDRSEVCSVWGKYTSACTRWLHGQSPPQQLTICLRSSCSSLCDQTLQRKSDGRVHIVLLVAVAISSWREHVDSYDVRCVLDDCLLRKRHAPLDLYFAAL